ncbi:MAG: nuclear transport factor 2 family protein [Actinomycetota bacterium]
MSLTTDDQVEIWALYNRYNHTIDSGDGPGFAACFTEDGHLDTGSGTQVGADAISTFAAANKEMMPGLRHLAHNVVTDGDGEVATGSAFLVAYDVTGGHKVLATGTYADDLVKTPAGWRFTKRVFTSD